MPSEDRFTDHGHLRGHSYPNSSRLQDRAQIYRFAKGESFPEWVLSHVNGHFGDVLDVGCGPGLYMRKLQPRANSLVGIDLSHGMALEAKEVSQQIAVADAERLPFESSAFDTTLCLHMLYHVADIAAAVSELRRVTKADGRALVVTNGEDHMRELREGFDRSARDALRPEFESALSGPRRFRMEDAEQYLRGPFERVDRYDYRRRLEVTDADAVRTYLASLGSFHGHKLAGEWAEAIDCFHSKVEEIIREQGKYEITVHSGMFLCG